MVEALLSLFGGNGLLIGIGAALLAIFGAFIKGRLSGAQRERDKQAAERIEAITKANEVDNDIGAMPPDARREELKKWAR